MSLARRLAAAALALHLVCVLCVQGQTDDDAVWQWLKKRKKAGLGAAAGGGPALVGSIVQNSTSSGVASLTAPAINLVTGNAVAVWIRVGSTGSTINAPTDTAGNTYTSCTSVTETGTGNGQWWYKLNATGNASNVVTGNWTGTPTFDAIFVVQVSGVTAIDVCSLAGATNASAASLPSNLFSTSGTSDFILYGVNVGNTNLTFSPGLIGGTTATALVQDTAQKISAVEYLVGTGSSITAAMSWGASNHCEGNALSFK